MSSKRDKPPTIAVCGKGGVGKTSISALFSKIFSEERNQKVLAVDADPAVGLASALGVSARRTVDDIRNELIESTKAGIPGDRSSLISQIDYEIFEALEERKNLAFLAIGRPEADGCYCQINRFLKEIIHDISDNFDIVVIDGEAGIEQVNRRVMDTVTHLILVSDASVKGLNVAYTIKKVSDKIIDYEKTGLILNRISSREEKEKLSIPNELNLVGWVPEDNTIRSCDLEGGSILELPECPAIKATRQALKNIGL